MKRVQVQLTDDQFRTLRERADEAGEGVASVVRKVVAAWIANEEHEILVQRALDAIGGFHSGLGDLAERHDEYLGEGM